MTTEFVCPDATGPGPCKNPVPHHDPPKNCVHYATSTGDPEQGYDE